MAVDTICLTAAGRMVVLGIGCATEVRRHAMHRESRRAYLLNEYSPAAVLKLC